MRFFVFFLFVFIFSSIRDKCIAPTKMPPQPPSSYQRILTIILTRHGSRTPCYYFPDAFFNNKNTTKSIWNCIFDNAAVSSIGLIKKRNDPKLTDYPPSCNAGELTVEGIQQHQRLGAAFRSYLEECESNPRQNLIFGNYLNPDEIYVRTTAVERAYRSCVSFLQGFAPPSIPYESIKIISGTESFDMLRPNKRNCAELANMFSKYYNSDVHINELVTTYDLMKDVYAYLHLEIEDPKLVLQNSLKNKSDQNDKDVVQILKNTDDIELKAYFERLDTAYSRSCDFVVALDCFESKDFTFPNVSLERQKQIVDICEKEMNKVLPETQFYSFSQAFREIFDIIDKRISMNTQIKMALFSAHDSTIAAMLNALGQKQSRNPPYASHVITDIVKKGDQYYIRFSFNGDVLLLPSSIISDSSEFGITQDTQNGIYSLHEFRMKFQAMIDNCNDFDEF